MTDSSTAFLVGVAIPTLRELRSAVLRTSSPDDAVTALREAGFAGGDAVHAAYERWLAESGITDPAEGRADSGELTIGEFGRATSRFFRDAGWGDVTFSANEDEGVAVVEIANCWEGSASSVASGCHITTGLLAAFFGRIAGYPVAVLETDCCGGDGSSCRFLMGNSEVMQYQWEQLQ
jgi:predicted hydrocarbon binding protein